MEKTLGTFFLWINRINAVLLLLVLLGGGAGLAWLGWSSAHRHNRNDTAATAHLDDHPRGFVFSRTERVIGSDNFLIRLTSMSGSQKASAVSRYADEMRNVLFMSGSNERAGWLFDTHANLLLVVDQLRPVDRVILVRTSQREFAELDRDEPTRALYFEFADADTNKDGEISREDDITVALSKPDGSGLKTILTGATRVLSRGPIGENGLIVLYQSGHELWYARFRLDTFEKVSAQVVLRLPQQR